jgi:hypothetical protein
MAPERREEFAGPDPDLQELANAFNIQKMTEKRVEQTEKE